MLGHNHSHPGLYVARGLQAGYPQKEMESKLILFLLDKAKFNYYTNLLSNIYLYETTITSSQEYTEVYLKDYSHMKFYVCVCFSKYLNSDSSCLGLLSRPLLAVKISGLKHWPTCPPSSAYRHHLENPQYHVILYIPLVFRSLFISSSCDFSRELNKAF